MIKAKSTRINESQLETPRDKNGIQGRKYNHSILIAMSEWYSLKIYILKVSKRQSKDLIIFKTEYNVNAIHLIKVGSSEFVKGKRERAESGLQMLTLSSYKVESK